MVKKMMNRKLARDMWKSRMQFLAIIWLCAFGTWVFSGLDAAWRMLDLSAQTYFDSQNTAQLWVTLNDVENGTAKRVGALEGVKEVQLRAASELKVDLPHEPSLVVEAYDGDARINIPLLRAGEGLNGADLRGCLLDELFADANGLSPGDTVSLKLGGETYPFVIRGTCLSAEFVSLSKNSVRDPLNYGFVVINSRAMEALPLNELLVTVEEDAEIMRVENGVKELYPSALVINRVAQVGIHGISTDVDMFRNLSYIFPLLAFAVAAMIVLTTITRMLENQRLQMGSLKALGYGDGQIMRHYLSYAFYPSLIGSLLGLVVGRAMLPPMLWKMEESLYTLPWCLQAPVSWLQWLVCGLGVLLSCGICLHTYRKSAREQTASLLRPKPPRAGRKLLLERIDAIWSRMGFNAKMVVRNLFRNKARTLMSLIGSLCCTMLIMTSMGLQDSMNYFVGKYYDGTLRYTVRAELSGETGEVETYRKRVEAERLEGVMERTVSARTGQEMRTTQLTVLEDDQRLMYLGKNETYVDLPQCGVMLTQKLSQVLKLKVGDPIALWLPGDDKPILETVTGIAYVTIGQGVMVPRSTWESYLKGDFRPTALLALNPTQRGYQTLDALDELDELQYPYEQRDDTLSILSSVTGIFALMSFAALGLAFVVLYNMGILNFMERYREYATLKVLGYHQKEIRRLMTVENNLVAGIGVLLGIAPGWWLTGTIMLSCETDTMVFAYTVEWPSIAIACVVTFVFSYLITRLLTLKVKTIDMVEALKSVE